MKKSSRLKASLSLLLVSTLAATIMPTSVNADPTEFEDNVVTVEVDLGSEGPDPELCEGFATLVVPGNTMTAALNRRVDGIDSPTMTNVLAYYFGDYDDETNSADPFDGEDLQFALDEMNNTGGNIGTIDFNAVTDPESATLSTLVSIDYDAFDSNSDGTGDVFRDEDLDQDEDIDVDDAPEWITETRRSYSTNWFTVSYDANDCVDSDDMAVVLVGREPVMRAPTEGAGWNNAEIVLDDWYAPTLENRAEAYLKLKTNLIGGLISLPYSVAWETTEDFSDIEGDWYYDPISYGDEGSAQMKSVMSIYGADPSGIYQTNYYYQLEVNDEEYFDEFGWFGCFLGGCLP
jgi:hypothetical protein